MIEIKGFVYVGKPEEDYFHVIKTTWFGKFALSKYGTWIRIGKGGGLIQDCIFKNNNNVIVFPNE